jgi:hypothetical protein
MGQFPSWHIDSVKVDYDSAIGWGQVRTKEAMTMITPTDPDMTHRPTLLHSLVPVVVAVVVTAGAVVGLIIWVGPEGSTHPEIVLPIVFIVGVLVLLLVIGTLAIVMKNYRLANKRMPLGLPDGSMRALISLLIVVLFFIIAIFVLRELQQAAEPTKFEKLSQEQADAIPLETQVSRIQVVGTDENPLFNVIVKQEIDESIKTYSVQLLATVSTLVVAVSAFYFGTSSTTTAFAAANRDTVEAGVQQEKVLQKIGEVEGGRQSQTPSNSGNAVRLLRISQILRGRIQ